MEVTRIHDKGQTLQTPKGKLLGIVDTRAQFDAVARSLEKVGVKKGEALSGDEGVHLLERVHTFFFSDMEDRVLKRHIEELKEGHIIIAIDIPSDSLDEAARVATENGARRLDHFGSLTVTWLTK